MLGQAELQQVFDVLDCHTHSLQFTGHRLVQGWMLLLIVPFFVYPYSMPAAWNVAGQPTVNR